MADLNEVVAKDESFDGNDNASLTIHTDNDERSKDIAINGTAHSSTFNDDKKINAQCSENAPLPGPSSDMAHTPNLEVKDGGVIVSPASSLLGKPQSLWYRPQSCTTLDSFGNWEFGTVGLLLDSIGDRGVARS
ncbi:hypothetical protein L2E82_35677 [Cichorium intybus]|uniref:Uncharacterized protein n=1 Tax=Cichorium intybus TaxID=13427 RepID=A0ACB9BPI3_CICIN|nr:hypothetical protein L2E82_35677 [Cichorium intybus]